MSFPISGKTALVTGANRGIGKAIVEALVTAGAAKVYAGARNTADLVPLIARHGSKVVALRLDVTNSAHIEAAIKNAPDVQLLVNNAGIVRLNGLDLQNLQLRTSRLQVAAIRPGRRTGLV